MGRALGAADSTACQQNINFDYTASSVTQTCFIANRTSIVTGIIGRPRVAGTGGACTLAFYKVPNATAVGSGTLLHTGTYDVTGTADTNQTMTLVTDQTKLTLQPGDGLGYVLTGTPTSAVGTFTIFLEPV